MGQTNPPPTNNNYKRLITSLILKPDSQIKHPRYISNMAQNIINARTKATEHVLKMRGKKRKQLTNKEKANNESHKKQLVFWRRIKTVVNAMQNTATRTNGNVNLNVLRQLNSRRKYIVHG